ncbi:LCP family protein [Streptococcus equinus]|uniref:LCP family protein n=1 Tax=Streptococcus equinus TaxID=1335 RepID=UPI0008D3A157|nr:LCP family protein [Streptococcus equinus]SEI52269.1 transcriptional attenuator, LytR family [Streptococcus equinus]
MANNRLSRHEELRYQYLLGNLEYLNAQQKEEFDYLYQKKLMSMQQPSNYSSSAYNETYDDQYDDYGYYDDYNNDYYDDYEDSAAYVDYDDYSGYDSYDNQVTSQGLPKYPKFEKVSRPKRKHQKKLKKSSYLDYYEDIDDKPVKKVKKSKKKKRKKRLKHFLQFFAMLIVLVMAGMIYMFFHGVKEVSSGETNYSAAVTEPFNGQDSKDGTNILILGSDKRISQGSSDARTDTIMVLNIGNKEGKVKLVSFMRDTLVNINGVSYNDYANDQKLNVAFNIGEQDESQGAELMRKTLKDNFDINIKYYVMVDFETFAEAINTLFPNGVDIDAKFGTVDGQEVSSVEVPDDLNMRADGTVPNQTIEVGEQKMDGRTLLNYARFRKDDDGDYGRTQRQQQVISAIVSQIKDPSKLFTGSAAIGKIYALTSTNVSYPFLVKEGLGVVTSGKKGIEQKTIPEEGDWTDDYDMYGGLGISIDFNKYQEELKELGLR